MDENEKPDGSTAMERLARELMGAVVSCAPTVWCGEHGIGIRGTRPEQDREHARADIERRIADARADDSGVHPWTMYEMAGLREKSAGLDALCVALGADDGDEALIVVGDLLDERCELKELREAGRIVPEGASWPRYRDGGPAVMDGEAWTNDGRRMRVVAVSHRGKVAVRPWGAKGGSGARWMPASSLLGERPDSWERLREDAANSNELYWGCGDVWCSDCPARVGGKTPKEHYRTNSCGLAMQLDIVARAERLAGVRDDG